VVVHLTAPQDFSCQIDRHGLLLQTLILLKKTLLNRKCEHHKPTFPPTEKHAHLLMGDPIQAFDST
jgi:hypothetical protein